MKEETYGITIETNDSMEVAEERVRAALASVGFGVLTEIDVSRFFEHFYFIFRANLIKNGLQFVILHKFVFDPFHLPVDT